VQLQRRAVQPDYLEYSVDSGDGLRGELGLMSYVAGMIAGQLDSLDQGGMGRVAPRIRITAKLSNRQPCGRRA
jgi:hypothetical protein